MRETKITEKVKYGNNLLKLNNVVKHNVKAFCLEEA